MSLWLLAIVVPVALAGWYAVGHAESQIKDRIVADLLSVQRLEVARIDQALDNYRADAVSLASGRHVIDFTAATTAVRSGTAINPDAPIGGVDGFAWIDPHGPIPLEELARTLNAKARTTGSEVEALAILDLDGTVLGSSDASTWTPQTSLLRSVAATTEVQFGAAFRTENDRDRLGLVAPIMSDSQVVGYLKLETSLGPIVDLVAEHEGFGDTSEAHIAQPTTDGDAEFITPLRFARDAAFNKIVPSETALPINASLHAPEGEVMWSPDYRQTESVLAIQTIEATGWGLVVKIDKAEALQPITDLRNTLYLAGSVGLALILVGWLILVDPLTRRIRRTALAAIRVADGNYDSPIGDRASDEIGKMGDTIDHLAAQLAADITARAEIEDQLRRQATHDGLTELINRHHASTVIDEMLADDDLEHLSVLFLDLDGFKAINDTYGHGIGDEVLAACARRLVETIAGRGTVARWGGDEFVIILPDVPATSARTIAADVHRAFRAPVATNAGEHLVRFSIGSSSLASDTSVDDIVLRADESMFLQKRSRSSRRGLTPHSLRTVEAAFRDNRVDVWFQPIIDLSGDTPRVTAAEALLRIRDERGEVLLPSPLISEVQSSQLGAAVDRKVIASAMRHAASWMRRGLVGPDFRLNVNCGESLLRDADTVDFLAAELEATGMRAENIVLELSEESSVARADMLLAVRNMGMQIAIDDVGLRSSNLDRLVDSRASIAKLDRRWMPTDTDEHPEQTRIVLEHLISLCRDLDMTIVAECVEDPDQVATLRSSGVNVFQGNYFGAAMPGLDFERLCRVPLRPPADQLPTSV